jgi:hypothetical protein
MARALNAFKSRTPIRLPHSAYGQLLKGCL